jgi:hypothetical protein
MMPMAQEAESKASKDKRTQKAFTFLVFIFDAPVDTTSNNQTATLSMDKDSSIPRAFNKAFGARTQSAYRIVGGRERPCLCGESEEAP